MEAQLRAALVLKTCDYLTVAVKSSHRRIRERFATAMVVSRRMAVLRQWNLEQPYFWMKGSYKLELDHVRIQGWGFAWPEASLFAVVEAMRGYIGHGSYLICIPARIAAQ